MWLISSCITLILLLLFTETIMIDAIICHNVLHVYADSHAHCCVIQYYNLIGALVLTLSSSFIHLLIRLYIVIVCHSFIIPDFTHII